MTRLGTFAGTVCGLVVFLSVGLQQADAAHARHHASFVAGHEMLNIINADRRASGLQPLAFDVRAAHVALAHSKDMAVHGYFSHYTPSGASPFERMRGAGIAYREAGENLGYDSGGTRASMLRDIEVAMLNSPEHRANLLRRGFTRVGIGIARTGNSVYVTEDFTG